MSKVQFLAACPGCGDNHVGIDCKKPSFIVPTTVKVVCDKCDSASIYQVFLPNERTSKSQLAYRAIKLMLSEKLVLMMEEAKKQAEEQNQTKEATNETATDNNFTGYNVSMSGTEG